MKNSFSSFCENVFEKNYTIFFKTYMRIRLMKRYLKKYLIHIAFFSVCIVFISGVHAFRLDNNTILESLYKVLQLFTLESISISNHTFFYEIARWIAALVFGFAVLQVVLFFAKNKIDEILIRLLYRKHIIVCGLTWKAKELLDEYIKDNYKIIIIEVNKDHEDISEYMQYNNIKIIIGDAEDNHILRKANIFHAGYLFAFTENDQTNLNIISTVNKIFSDYLKLPEPEVSCIQTDNQNAEENKNETIASESCAEVVEQSSENCNQTDIQNGEGSENDSYASENITQEVEQSDDKNNKNEEICKHVLNVRIHLNGLKNLMMFKEFHKTISFSSKNNLIPDSVDFHAFNVHQIAAQKIVDDFSPDKFDKINNDKPVHILVSGLTIQGEFLIAEAAHMYHFSNLKKLKITIVDNNISEKFSKLLLNYPNIEQVVDFEKVDMLSFYNYARRFKLKDISVCFVSHEEDADTIMRAIMLRQLFMRLNCHFKLPKIVAITTENYAGIDFIDNPSDNKNNLPQNMKCLEIEIKNLYKAYCTKKIIVDNEENYDKIAQYIDYIYTKETEYVKAQEKINNHNSNDWVNKTDFKKDYNRYPARHLEIKLRTINKEMKENIDNSNSSNTLRNLKKEEKELLAKMEHRRWLAEKWLTGFVPNKTGKTEIDNLKLKDVLKFHHLLKDWDSIGEEEQKKDYYTIDNIGYILEKINRSLTKYEREA
jgi:hypothetical protein